MTLGVVLLIGAGVLLVRGLWADAESARMQALILQQLHAQGTTSRRLPAEGSMSIVEIDGRTYVGVLTIPSLGLEVPVQGEWNTENMRVSPCHWSGSVYDNDLIVVGTAYRSQFGALGNLAFGDTVSVEDIYGNVFEYQVTNVQVSYGVYGLSGTTYPTEDSEPWDLKLYTYSSGGFSGTIVYCERVLS